MSDEKTTVHSLEDALSHLGVVEEKAAKQLSLFQTNFQEFVGYHPNQHVTAVDVVKIVSRMLTGKKENVLPQ